MKGQFEIHRRSGNGDAAGSKAFKLTAANCVDPDLSIVHKGTTFTKCDGTTAEGTYTTIVPCNQDGQDTCYPQDNYIAADTTKFAASDIAVGVTLAGVTGTHRLSRCRSGVDNATYNSNGLPTNNAEADGGSLEWWDTITDITASSGLSQAMGTGDAWGPDHYCYGYQMSDVTNTATNLTPTAVAPQGLRSYCAGAGTNTCQWGFDFAVIMHDPYTGLYISNTLTQTGGTAAQGSDWQEATLTCDRIDSGDGQGKWRIPTQKEMMLLSVGGLWQHNVPLILPNSYWVATTTSSNTAQGMRWVVGSYYSVPFPKANGHSAFCVR